MHKERYVEAAYVLGPIANNPHGGESLAPVRRLLAEAREKAGLPPLSPDAPPEAEAPGEAPPSESE